VRSTRNIATYRPSQPLQDGVHLVAGCGWLTQHLDDFKAQLKETPLVYNVGDVGHFDLPDRDECVTSWIQLINDILVNTEACVRQAPECKDATPTNTPGMFGAQSGSEHRPRG
jgi:hypothetical protein